MRIEQMIDQLTRGKQIVIHNITELETLYQTYLEQSKRQVCDNSTGYDTRDKKLPIGIDEYRILKEGNYYIVDKTNMIEEFANSGSLVTLITRPRRFGKTLNMSMLVTFFDITQQSSHLFHDTAIAKSLTMSTCNQYPVIYMTFRNAKGSRKNIVKFIKKSILQEYKRYQKVLAPNLHEYQEYERMMQKLQNDTLPLEDINDSILMLSEYLFSHYEKRVMLFIDEYDTPFLEAYEHDCYEELHTDLSMLISTALKGNPYLEKALLTGIQRIAKDNLFSGLNNLDLYTLCDQKYQEYFGFTAKEATELLQYYDLTLNDQVKRMYNGYHIGTISIYNAWSLICYASHRQLDAFWVNTGSNLLIRQLIEHSGEAFVRSYHKLMEHQIIWVWADISSCYFNDQTCETLWGLLIHAGYVTVLQQAKGQYQVTIPNQEVFHDFRSISATLVHTTTSMYQQLLMHLIEGREEAFSYIYQQMLMKLPSDYDLIQENSYHMLLLGICGYLQDLYEVKSNHEQGLGRCDIYLQNKTGKQDIVLEFKYTKDANADLKELAMDALQQIKNRQYALKDDTLAVGLAHHGKQAHVMFQQVPLLS